MRRRWIVAVFVAVAVALGMASNAVEARLKPYGSTSVSGSIGEDVHAFPYVVHVNGAQVAEHVVQPDIGGQTAVDSDGVWVVVDLSYASVDMIQTPWDSSIMVRDGSGREYPISPRSDTSTWAAGPDIWHRGDLAFEVAPDAVGSLSLVFDPIIGLYGPMPTRYALIPLQLEPGALEDSVELSEVEPLAVGER